MYVNTTTNIFQHGIPTTGETIGALQNSITVSVFLFGILTLQVYYYFEHHSGDGPYIKAFTGLIWVLELIHTIAMLHIGYYMTILTNLFAFFISPTAEPVRSTDLTLLLTAFLGVLVQIFFGLRLRLLSNRWEVPIACWILGIGSTALMIVVVALFNALSPAEFFAGPQARPVIVAMAIITTAMDLTTSSSLCYYMVKKEGMGGLGVRKYILLFLESEGFVVLVQMAVFVTTIWSTGNFIYTGLTFIRAKTLVNTFLAALNSRHLWKSGLPLIDLGKKPSFPILPQNQKVNDLRRLDIHVEHSSLRFPSPISNDDGVGKPSYSF